METEHSNQSIIERLQQQILSQLYTPTQPDDAAAQPPRRPTRSRFYHPPPLHTNLESDLEEVRQQNRNHYIRELLAIAREYQREQREYHQTMNTILSLLARMIPSYELSASPSPTTETTEPSSVPPPTPLRRHSYLDRLRQMNRQRNRLPTATATTTDETASALDNIFISYFFASPQNRENAVAPLTERQIQQNTRVIRYDTSMNETRCPITMEDFAEGEEVLQIAGCGHFFKREALMEWFRRNHLCPVCRHRLLRGGGTRFTTTATTATTTEEPNPTLEELSDNVAINGIVEEPEDSEDDEATVRAENSNRVNSPSSATYRMFEDRYTFELPLLYDTSNNVFYSENNEPIENNRDLQQTIQRELLNAFHLFRSPRTQP